jgi:hypothetical protein
MGAVTAFFSRDLESVQGEVSHCSQNLLHSAKCFVSMQFSNGLLQREFVVRNPDNTALTKQAMSQKIGELSGRIQEQIDPVFGTLQHSHWFVVMKDMREGLFHRVTLNHSDSRFDCAGSGPVLIQAIDFAYQNFITDTGFAKGPLLQDGNFKEEAASAS